MRSEEIQIRTGAEEVVHDLTRECERFLADENGDGLLHVWVPHATAGVAVIETGAGSDDDLLTALERILPHDVKWRHRHGTPGHGRDHVMPALRVIVQLNQAGEGRRGIVVERVRMTCGKQQHVAVLNLHRFGLAFDMQIGFAVVQDVKHTIFAGGEVVAPRRF